MKNWKSYPFEQCIEKVKNTRKIPASKFKLTGDFPIVSQEKSLVNGYWDIHEDVITVNKPVVVFGDHTKNIKYVDFSFVKGADGTKVFLPKSFIDSKFFFYQLMTIKLPELGYARHYKHLKRATFCIPDYVTQELIVSKLDQAFQGIDQAIENTEKNLENVEELFQNTRHKILSANKEGWKIQPLRDVCIVERGSSPRPIKKYLTDDGDGVNWIKIGDTKNVNKYIFDTNQKITKEGAEKSRRVDSGDFILSNSMSYGKPYIMKTTGYIHDGWFKLKFLDFIDSEYMYHLLSSKNVVEQFHNLANGSVVKNISGDLVKKVLLPIPTKEEQLKITVDLDTLEKHINELKSKYNEKLSNLKELKMSILEKAFKGELV